MDGAPTPSMVTIAKAKAIRTANNKVRKATRKAEKDAATSAAATLAVAVDPSTEVPSEDIIVPLEVHGTHNAFFCGGYVYCRLCARFGSGSQSTLHLREACVPRPNPSAAANIKRMDKGHHPYSSRNRSGGVWPGGRRGWGAELEMIALKSCWIVADGINIFRQIGCF